MSTRGMRVLHESTYRERMAEHRERGRREIRRVYLRRTIALLVVGGLMLGGIGLVSSRGADGGRTESPYAKWVRLFAEHHTDGTIKAGNVVVECRGIKCAAYNRPGTPDLEMVVVHMANGRFHVLELLGPEPAMGVAP